MVAFKRLVGRSAPSEAIRSPFRSASLHRVPEAGMPLFHDRRGKVARPGKRRVVRDQHLIHRGELFVLRSGSAVPRLPKALISRALAVFVLWDRNWRPPRCLRLHPALVRTEREMDGFARRPKGLLQHSTLRASYQASKEIREHVSPIRTCPPRNQTRKPGLSA